MHIAVYLNTFHGDLIPVGPFPSLSDAKAWVASNVEESKRPLWNVCELIGTEDVPTSPLVSKLTGVRPV